jgi:ribosome-associated heat shock protein Hsp15
LSEPVQRLDKWLWHARFCKSRALAQKLIELGQVSINGAVAAKASAQVRAGDRLSVVLGPVRRTVVVRQVEERRLSPPEARSLYDEPAEPERLSPEHAGLPVHRRF